MTIWRLRSFFPADQVVGLVTAKRAQEIYDRYCKTPTKTGRVPADTTQLNVVREAATFMRWCLKRKLTRIVEPFAEVETVGTRSSGKDQLRIDEARRWETKAIELANKGKAGAVAALLALWAGIRESEIVTRECRDFDDNGTLLWVAATRKKNERRAMKWTPKSRAGYREVPVLPEMQGYLQALTKGRSGDEYIFLREDRGGHRNRGWVLDWVRKICRLAGVPRVTAHGMRGLHATLAEMGGGTVEAVITRQLGHSQTSTTHGSYTDPTALALATQRRFVTVMRGGKK